jgi:23S rRNA (uracil1939-C5)-methyltransferase
MTDTFTLDLTTMAHGGFALGRHHKRVIFVPYTLPGERVTARITREKKSFAHAEVLEVVRPSPDRVEPPCPHFGPGKCGGCHWQHIAYERQIEYKQAVLVDQLERLGKFETPPVRPTVPAPHPWGYRVHATFTVAPDGRLGFHSDRGSRVVPIETCHILHPALLDLFEGLDLSVPEIERVRFQVGSDPDDCMIVIQTADDLPPEVEVDFPISVNLLLSDNEPANLIGRSHVTYHVLNRSFRVTAGSFFQVNLPITEVLVGEVLDRLALQGGETVLDLYSGVGLFTAFIAARAGMVVSVESYPPAVTDADQNLADLDNVDLVEGGVETVLDNLVGPFDAVVVDPPRTGLSADVIDGLVRLAPPRIVYVSCDPATFARDVRQLVRHGYRLLDVLPVDMFPQTFHIECVATLDLGG